MNEAQRITLQELLYDILPKLKAAEVMIQNTLLAILEATEQPLEQVRRQEQQEALELELFTIRLHIKHLLTRYSQDVQAMRESERNGTAVGDGPVLTLDDGEAQAIEKAKMLHERLVAMQKALAKG
ncbi:hypothetical protein [Billgrantia montanilacus]|uniref:Uncharacterized protein n=1 Tax=Billgrantia montanilacus TaxID=2282305 RepID=A0A368U492_9GAMM|nr:hypothetical protein [Halomonas montanilacus]RCV90912.1 hypothetical protein DU505_03145 [Halomonas montanilacus]